MGTEAGTEDEATMGTEDEAGVDDVAKAEEADAVEVT
jgi:hypothetical protein